MRHKELLIFCGLVGLVGLSACGSDSSNEGGAAQGAAGSAGVDAGAEDIDADDPSGDAAAEMDAGADLEVPDAACLPPNKICNGACVEASDPDYGCGPDTCQPCAQLPSAQMGCANNECVVLACDQAHADCDADSLNGCETDIGTLENCGSCGAVCSIPNAQAACEQGVCVIESCGEYRRDCNANPMDGCETDIRSIDNCGGCGAVCSIPNAQAACEQGVCVIQSCNDGFYDCNLNPSDGCESSSEC